MSTAANAALAWFPLVPRPRPPCLPLRTRIAELAALAADRQQETPRQQATQAAHVLNKAALIASDCGIPALARALCHRQYQLLAPSAPLPGWAVTLALQPILNLARQLVRDGQGGDAHTTLQALHHAALRGAAIDLDGIRIDFAALAANADARREACTLTWTALLADGTRALAQEGRWGEAAAHAAASRGTGARLLDGRQAAILSLIAAGRSSDAAEMTRQSAIAEPWEYVVRAVLLVLCQRPEGQDLEPGTAAMISAARWLTTSRDPATVVGRARIGLTALELAGDKDTASTNALRAALIEAGTADGRAARDLLASSQLGRRLHAAQRSGLEDTIRACGLGAGTIPARLHHELMRAADRASAALTGICLSADPEACGIRESR